MERVPRGSFLVSVKRDKQGKGAYRFTVRDLRTGQRQDAESLTALERFILEQFSKQGLR